MEIVEKVAYLKGLMEGLQISSETKEGKIFQKIADILEELANGLEELGMDVGELNDRVDEIDEDLAEVEDDVYGDEDDDSADEDYCDGDCEECDGCEDAFYEVTCGECGEKINVTEEVIQEGSMRCPRCNAELIFDVEYEEENADGEDNSEGKSSF